MSCWKRFYLQCSGWYAQWTSSVTLMRRYVALSLRCAGCRGGGGCSDSVRGVHWSVSCCLASLLIPGKGSLAMPLDDTFSEAWGNAMTSSRQVEHCKNMWSKASHTALRPSSNSDLNIWEIMSALLNKHIADCCDDRLGYMVHSNSGNIQWFYCVALV